MPSIPRRGDSDEPPSPQEQQTAVHDAPAVAAPEGATVETPAVQPDAPAPGETTTEDPRPGFRERTRMRRRLRYLRRLRELAIRDLGGLVFDLHRFGRERSDLVEAKLEALRGIDAELRALETAVHDHRDFTDLHEAGIAACPHCGTLHDSDASFCPGCGTALRRGAARDAEQPAVAPAEGEQAPAPAPEQTPASTP